jgi:hypothetical protein
MAVMEGDDVKYDLLHGLDVEWSQEALLGRELLGK